MSVYLCNGWSGFAEDICEESTRLVAADWLEQQGYQEFAAHLRNGTKPLKRLDSSDWEAAFEYASGRTGRCTESRLPTASPPGSTVGTWPVIPGLVRSIVAIKEGESDEEDWLIVAELWDGRFFALRAGCDYTGWG